MGQALSDALGDSPPPHDTLDPGPLSDAELAEALKRFAEHATDGALAQGAFDAIAGDKQDDFAAAARHASFYDAARRVGRLALVCAHRDALCPQHGLALRLLALRYGWHAPLPQRRSAT